MLSSFARRASLRCEPLEHRDCPAIFGSGAHLTVVGTSGADTIDITDDGAGHVSVTLNGTTQTANGVHSVTVVAGAGDDTVTYSLTGEQTGRTNVVVIGGKGNDTVTLSGGTDTTSGATLNAPTITGHFKFLALGQQGDDTLSAHLDGVASGATAAVLLNGGLGADQLTVDAAGEYDGALGLVMFGGVGNDTITGTVDVASGSTGRVLAWEKGDTGNDDMTLNVTGDGATGLTSLYALLDGGAGHDTGTATDNVTKRRL